jgi:hypothetical protein
LTKLILLTLQAVEAYSLKLGSTAAFDWFPDQKLKGLASKDQTPRTSADWEER